MKKYYKNLALILLFAVSSSCCGFLDSAHPKTSKGFLDYPKVPLRNEAVVKYVNSIGQRLFQNVVSPPHGISKVDVVVLETSRIQGMSFFYSPRIEVTRGMLNVIRNEAELAALVGHEIGHKVLHSNKRAPVRDSEVTMAKWNQQQEKEADEYGALLAGKTGYDPYALIDFFDRLSCFQERSIFTMMDEWSATHKDFVNRSKDLRKTLERKGVARDGLLKAKEYKQALAPLRSVHTRDIVNEILPGGPNGIFPMLAEIEAEVLSYEKTHKPMPPVRFVEIMDELSGVVKRCGMESDELLTGLLSAHKPSFMKEVMSQDSPLWADEELQKKLENILQTISRIGIGFIPVIGDAVDLYEFLTGKEFGTGYKLTFGERVITAAGLLAGSGAGWRKAADGIGETLQDGRLASKLGRRTVADADAALDRGRNIFEGSISTKRNCTVLGHYPRYIELANEIGARKFDVPINVWNKMTSIEKWVANQKFLDRLIKRGDEIILATPVKNVDDMTGYFRRELDYLIQKGYRLNVDGTRMIKP